MSGVYDQLENLNRQPPIKHGPVESPDAPETVETTPSAPTPINGKNWAKKSPTSPQADQVPTSDVTRNFTPVREPSSDVPREKPRSLPSRTEIQEFSFRLRDDHKVKVQAEVPYEWQDELEEISRKLDVKKL